MKIPKARKLPSGKWFIQLRLGGESVSITRPTERQAIRAAELIKAEYRNGIKSAVSGGEAVLQDAIAKYIQERENVLSPSTIIGYRDIARNRFQSVMKQPLASINWQKVVDTESRLCSPKTVRNAFGFIKSVYTENGVEITAVRLPAAVKPDKQWLTPEQIPVFLEAIKGQKCEIPALLALHSLRKSEVCGLEWKDVDLSSDVASIRVAGALLINEEGEWKKRAQNKTYSSARKVPIFIPQLRAALEAVEDKSGFVVRQHPETPYRQIQKICRENDLPLVGWHGLRHSFASLCYSLGINELACMQLGGWSDYQTMRKIYTHLSENDRDKTVDKLADFFKNANENANEKSTDQ